MKNRVYNFAAGPSMLADEVLNKLHEEFYNYEGSGMAVMEMSHRSKGYLAIFEDAKKRLRDIMEIPEDYEIFFMHGGATGQFAAVPMNLLRGGKADYIVTGNFSNKAAKEAQKYGTVHIAYDGKDNGYSHIPSQEELDLSEDARYVHLCSNNTIYGTEWKKYPDVKEKILVGDLSSDILSRRIGRLPFVLVSILLYLSVPLYYAAWEYETVSPYVMEPTGLIMGLFAILGSGIPFCFGHQIGVLDSLEFTAPFALTSKNSVTPRSSSFLIARSQRIGV